LARNDNTKGLLASQGVIPPLVKLLRSDNKSVQAAALCCIVNVSNNDDNEKKIAHENAIPLIVQLMKSNDEIVMNNAIWALNNLSM
jgi:HEAT repeat protein